RDPAPARADAARRGLGPSARRHLLPRARRPGVAEGRRAPRGRLLLLRPRARAAAGDRASRAAAAPGRALAPVYFRLRVGGFTLAVRSACPHPGLAASSRVRPFRARTGSDIALELVEADVPAAAGRPLFDSGGIWRVFRHGRGLLYTFRPPPGPGAPARGVLIDEARRRGRLFLPEGPFARRPGFALSY